MKIDLHVHTTVSSPCSLIDPERLIERAREAGLDAVCVTEHDEIKGAEVTRELGLKQGFPVFRGVEVFTDMGDMLVYGLYEDAPGWKVPFERLLERCREAGAAIVPAHSCRVTGELERIHGEERVAWLLDRVTALETHNGGCTPQGNAAAQDLARRFGLPGTGGSDAHHEFQVGRCYTVFEDDIESEVDLVAALRGGRYEGVYMWEPVDR
ncbi:MAG: PHP domain-containing protein [Actinobacteria bacterium]|nr:PHP domain-containing protein [Actinomycetota bacterium]MBU1944408.1 PHP domain-containing protein [Actinomycetota bacterium]MBU2688194.1 PHP domain-containing protein [Actinomycetota bacterium]